MFCVNIQLYIYIYVCVSEIYQPTDLKKHFNAQKVPVVATCICP